MLLGPVATLVTTIKSTFRALAFCAWAFGFGPELVPAQFAKLVVQRGSQRMSKNAIFKIELIGREHTKHSMKFEVTYNWTVKDC